jgi:hypothetical protein
MGRERLEWRLVQRRLNSEGGSPLLILITMKTPLRFLSVLLALCAMTRAQTSSSQAPQSASLAELKDRYDVIIAGAGTGGCGAAIQAARLGASVLLLEETDWIGGQMTAAAVTSMDEGGTLVRGRGIYRELVERIEAVYRPLGIDPETAYLHSHICVEPRVGRRILHEMLAAARGTGTLDLSLRSRVTKVLKRGDAVSGAEIEIISETGKSRRTLQSKVLIDATEWGDVIPLTGARYRVGNCLSDAIVPTQHVQDNTWTAVVKQYAGPVPPALLLAEKPPGYDDAVHQRFVKSLVAGAEIGMNDRPWTWARFIGYRGMPDSTRPGGTRAITRTHLNFNNDFPATVAEIEDPARRLATNRAMRLRTLQLLYYIQNTLGMRDWAVADDEGYDTPYNRAEIDAWLKEQPALEPYRAMLYHFPVMPYTRESRRIVGLHTLCAREIDRRPGHQPVQFATSVAIGDYPVDMHGSMQPRYLELDLDRAEDIPAKFGGHGVGPFAIPFESFIPEKVDGFLPTEKNLSQSRMANGATRLQPHTMLMGQAAGAIAALAVKHGVQPRSVNPVLVQRVLVEARDPLNFTALQDVASDQPDWPAIQLTTTHGMLPLEKGRFLPQQPVTTDALTEIVANLSGKASAGPGPAPDETVTRAAFAAALGSAMSGSNVRLEFSSAANEREQAITRSEAAQVVAEFLGLRATAKMTGAPQRLAWTSLRPASASSPTDVTSTMDADLRKLVSRKLIDAPDYWAANAVVGGKCDGGQVAELLTRAARAFDPAATTETAVDILLGKRVIGSADYWKKNAIPGRTCDGKNVAIVLRNLVKSGATLGGPK